MLTFNTARPNALLAALKAAIDSKKVETWSYDSNGDFTHNPPQWNRKAFLRPSVTAGQLAFGLIRPANGSIGTEVYAVYHGRFIEMMLAHFDSQWANVDATSMPTAKDNLRAA